MNEPETSTLGSVERDRMREQIAALQKQTHILLVALVLVSGTLCAYLGLMARRAKADFASTKPYMLQTIQNYERDLPRIEAFQRALTEYAKNNPEFAAILARHKLPQFTATPNGAPAPAQPPKPQ